MPKDSSVNENTMEDESVVNKTILKYMDDLKESKKKKKTSKKESLTTFSIDGQKIKIVDEPLKTKEGCDNSSVVVVNHLQNSLDINRVKESLNEK
jgi:pyrimidine operon attenuation protein/uracil phosphoribosyltransferase